MKGKIRQADQGEETALRSALGVSRIIYVGGEGTKSRSRWKNELKSSGRVVPSGGPVLGGSRGPCGTEVD